MNPTTRPIFRWQLTLTVVVVMAAAGTVEHLMGRTFFCPCGHIRLWANQVNGPENSQQLFDWYSFSHVIHGFLLYAAVFYVGRGRWSPPFRLLVALLVETAWELVENSPVIIDRYRHTNSVTYNGDSVLNSMSDIACALFGFALAKRMPIPAIVALAVVFELGTAVIVRDNLILNVIMLLHPFPAIRHWQAGG